MVFATARCRLLFSHEILLPFPCFLASLFVWSSMFAAAEANVLFISVDDLNDWEGALAGHPQAKTPHMDKLFGKGVLFTNAHCSQAVCTASRNLVLSGIHPASSGWYRSTTSMRKSYDRVMGTHKMLPEHLRDHGYETLAVGKGFQAGGSQSVAAPQGSLEIIAQPRQSLPKTDALPTGSKEWKGDQLDQRVEEWKAGEEIPDWLR
jgi:arylsulfatase A-like enzyme